MGVAGGVWCGVWQGWGGGSACVCVKKKLHVPEEKVGVFPDLFEILQSVFSQIHVFVFL